MKLIKTASGKSKIKISKKEWQSIGKKAGWTKESQGRMNRNEEETVPTTGKPYFNVGAPGSPARVKREYPELIVKLKEAKAHGDPIETAQKIIMDAGISTHSLDARSLLEVSGWNEKADKTDVISNEDKVLALIEILPDLEEAKVSLIYDIVFK